MADRKAIIPLDEYMMLKQKADRWSAASGGAGGALADKDKEAVALFLREYDPKRSTDIAHISWCIKFALMAYVGR